MAALTARASLVAAALVLGCGARSTLVDREAGEGAGAPLDATTAGSGGASPAAGVGGAAGDGGGGRAPAACTTLVWAGDPVLVREGPTATAREPHLVALDDTEVVLAVEGVEPSGAAALRYRALSPWGSWPPVLAPARHVIDVASGGTPLAVAEHDADRFAFAVALDSSNVLIATAGPTVGFSVDASVVRTTPRVRWLSDRLAPEVRLVAYGPENVLLVDLVDRALGGITTQLGALGCTTTAIASDAAAVDGGVIVASANGRAFDDCLDPDAPEDPRVLQTVVVRADGAIEPGGWVDAGGVVEDVLAASRPAGTAWLAWQTDADDYARVVPLAADGAMGTSGLSYGLHPGHALAILGWGDGLAVATSGLLPATGEGQVLVQLMDGSFGPVAHTVDGPPVPLAPRGRPALLGSPDGRSFLVAVEHGPDGSVALLRADCAG